MKFDLNVQNINFSQRSRQKSMDNFVADLISQKSKTASQIRDYKSKINIEKKLSRKHLNLNLSNSFSHSRNSSRN